MPDNNGDSKYRVGFSMPPKHTQFTKGNSGNPKGRPKGSQNLSTILAKAGRQRVRVTTNGKVRFITKFDATLLQLTNKAAAGDLKAIRELLCWIRSLADAEQSALPAAALHESDSAVMNTILERIRLSAIEPQNIATLSEAKERFGTDE
jgi:Family of unknown function (DUF5681)